MNRRNAIGKGAACLCLSWLLSACAQQASVTESDVWHARQDQTTVSVCYSAAVSTRAQVEALAVAECPAETPAIRLIDEDTFFNNCPLSKRNRVTFLCVAP